MMETSDLKFETLDTLKKFDTFKAWDTFETLDTVETLDTFETLDTLKPDLTLLSRVRSEKEIPTNAIFALTSFRTEFC